MKILPVILAVLAVVAIGCGRVSQLLPAPEVEITDWSPGAGAVYVGDTLLYIDVIEFKVFNHVDAIITTLELDYFESGGETPLDNLRPIAVGLIVREADSTTQLLSVPVPLTPPVLTYIATGDIAVARLTFRGEDAYGLEKTFDIVWDWGIYVPWTD